MKRNIYYIATGLIVFCFCCFSSNTKAQDIHFTQYFTSPLTLNPGMSGLTQGDWRAAANFRQQWSSVSDNPYVTASFSFDMALMKNKLPDGDALGIGLLGYYDKSGGSGYKNTTVGFSLAYHKAFGLNKQHTLSFGIQGALVQKSIAFSKLHFEDQYRYGLSYEMFPASRETFGNADLSYPDFNAGLVYSGWVSEQASWYAGVSYYHLTRPVETFLSGAQKINSRYTGFLGGFLTLDDNTLLYLSSMYQQQGPAWELLYGGTLGFILNEVYSGGDVSRTTTFYLGGWFRQRDAFAPYIGFEFSGFQLGCSYDITFSKASIMTMMKGAFECSLVYNGLLGKNKKTGFGYACPRF